MSPMQTGRSSFKLLSTLARNPLARSHLIFGANTNVGKTVITAGLVRASLLEGDGSVHYIKPLQCGGSDAAFVQSHCGHNDGMDRLDCQTLFSWDTPASPHVASRRENVPVSDDQVLASLQAALSKISHRSNGSTTWMETAGGALSPSSSSPDNRSPHHSLPTVGQPPWGWCTQGDLYRPLAPVAPVILCGDGRLGGISATLSTLESLLVRGYRVVGIVLLETDDHYDNASALREYVARDLKLTLANQTALYQNPESSIVSLPKLPPEPEPLFNWYASDQVTETLGQFNSYLKDEWQKME